MYYSSPLPPKSVIQLTAFIAFETGRKLNSVFCILLLVPLQTYIWQKKNWALLTDLLKVKSNMFWPDNCHTQKRAYSLNTHPWTFIGRFSWELESGYGALEIYFWPLGGSRVSLLNFEGGPWLLGSGVLVPLLHHALFTEIDYLDL